MPGSRSSARAFLQRFRPFSDEAPPIVHEALRSPGRPLDPETRSLMEARDFSQVRLRTGGASESQGKLAVGGPGDPFEQEADRMAEVVTRSGGASGESAPRHDFSRVRIHTDATAAESARAVGALAYTVGEHIVFGAGQFAPATGSGQRLLAHELAHVAQQGPAGGMLQRAPSPDVTEPRTFIVLYGSGQMNP
jgi:hypothetical protein